MFSYLQFQDKLEKESKGHFYDQIFYKRKGNILALGADEGRSKWRYAAVSHKQTFTRRFPNGEIR